MGNNDITMNEAMAEEMLRMLDLYGATPRIVEGTPSKSTSSLATQVGGNHYKDMKIQPVEYIHANGIGYFEGSVIKYVSRWRQKGGAADLEKAQHFLAILIELEKNRI